MPCAKRRSGGSSRLEAPRAGSESTIVTASTWVADGDEDDAAEKNPKAAGGWLQEGEKEWPPWESETVRDFDKVCYWML